MPNDAPDWIRVVLDQLVGRGPAFVPLGDVTSPALAADSVTETALGVSVSSSGGVLASFKAAAGSTIALVKAGAALVGTATAVNPLFGQATASGHLLVACVTASASNTEPTTAAAGWVKVVSVATNGGWCAIWAKPNCGAGETAPGFTCNNSGVSVMMAQLLEFSGAATASPTDQTATGNGTGNTLAIAAGAPDVAFGDLIVVCTHYVINGSGSGATFSDTFSNSAAAVQDGSVNADFGGNGRNSVFTHAIVPAAIAAQPLGVANWAYDVDGNSAPTAGSVASVVLAATPGKSYTISGFKGAIQCGATAPGQLYFQLLDGASVVYKQAAGPSAANLTSEHSNPSGFSRKGTAGNSATAQFNAAVAAASETAYVAGYLR